MEFEATGLTVDLERHNIDPGVIKLNPCQVVAVGAEVKGFGVGYDFFLVYPVTDAVEDGARDAYEHESVQHFSSRLKRVLQPQI